MMSSPIITRAWILMFAIAAGFLEPASARGCGWDQFAFNRSALFFGIDALSPASVWAVGSRNISNGAHRSLTEHWNGTAWSTVTSPDEGMKDALLSDAIIAADDMWAVGNFNKANLVQPLIEHWNGAMWSKVPSPSSPNYATLLEVAAVSTRDVWAVGWFQGAKHFHPLIEHWNGVLWSTVPAPVVPNSDNYLTDVAVAGKNDIWAVGFTVDLAGHDRTLTLHWNGNAWSIVPSADGPSDTLLSGVAVALNNSVWATGQLVGNDGIVHTLAELWNGTAWTIVPTPDANNIGNVLSSVSSTGASDVWAVGQYLTSDNLFHSLVEHFDGTQWTILPSPLTNSTVNWRDDVKAFSSTDAFVVASFTGADSIQHPFAEHYHC
jgi:hypothetical protein